MVRWIQGLEAPDLPYEVAGQLTKDARSAFSQSKRPARPDLPRLVQEAKDKAEKIKARQGPTGTQP